VALFNRTVSTLLNPVSSSAVEVGFKNLGFLPALFSR